MDLQVPHNVITLKIIPISVAMKGDWWVSKSFFLTVFLNDILIDDS